MLWKQNSRMQRLNCGGKMCVECDHAEQEQSGDTQTEQQMEKKALVIVSYRLQKRIDRCMMCLSACIHMFHPLSRLQSGCDTIYMQTERRIELSWKIFFADSESASKGGCKCGAESQLIDGICNQTGKRSHRFVDVLWCDISDIRTGKCAVKDTILNIIRRLF